MKFQCQNPECKKTFLYTAKKTMYNHFFPKGGDLTIPPILEDQTETHCCPYCHGLDFEEFVEPVTKICSVKSVELSEVDSWIAQGYEVKELYAKTATMVKKEATKV